MFQELVEPVKAINHTETASLYRLFQNIRLFSLMVKFATISTFSKQFISKTKRGIRRNAQHQCAKHLSEKHATELHQYYLIFDFLRWTKSTEEIRLIVAAIARWHKREDAPFEFWLNVKKI